jgi:hypothetical protein
MDRTGQAAVVAGELVEVLTSALAAEWEVLTRADVGTMERCGQRVLRVVGGALMERLACLRLANLASSAPACPRCGGATRLVDAARPRHLEGLLGPIHVRRAWYHCVRCRHGFAPLDRVWGLGRGLLSPGLARVVCRDGLEAAFGQGANLVAENLGVWVDEETVRAVTEGMGAVVEDDQREWTRWALPAEEAAPTLLAVEVDGVLLHERERWVETKLGRVAALGPALVVEKESGDRHLALGPSAYSVEVGTADAFWARLTREVSRAGLGRGVQTVVVLADGASWMWQQARHHLGLPGVRVVEIVDFYHASAHLSTVADAVFGPGTAQARDWLDRHRHRLRHEGVGPVLAALSALDPGDADARDEVRRAQGYVTDHAERMDYPACRARLLPIGSGAIESTAKNLMQQRQTQAGMRWTRLGAQRVASLRALHRSGRWDTFWQSQPLARLRVLREHTAKAACHEPQPTSTVPDLPPPATRPSPVATRITIDGKPWAKGTNYWRRISLTHPHPA